MNPRSAANAFQVSWTTGIGIGHGGANGGNLVNVDTCRNPAGTPVALNAFGVFFIPGSANAGAGFTGAQTPVLDWPNLNPADSVTYAVRMWSNNVLTDVTIPYGDGSGTRVIAWFMVEEIMV